MPTSTQCGLGGGGKPSNDCFNIKDGSTPLYPKGISQRHHDIFFTYNHSVNSDEANIGKFDFIFFVDTYH